MGVDNSGIHENIPRMDKEVSASNTVEFSAEEIGNIFAGEKFRGALGIAAKDLQEHNLETGFTVTTDSAKKIEIPQIVRGVASAVAPDLYRTIGQDVQYMKVIQVIDGERDFSMRDITSGRAKEGEVFNFHLHPSASRLLIPSSADLHGFLAGRYDGQIMAVGRIQKEGNAQVLLTKPRPEGVTEYDISGYKDFVRERFHAINSHDNKMPEVQEALSEIGIQSEYITYRYLNGQYFLLESAKRTIANLGSSKVTLTDIRDDRF